VIVPSYHYMIAPMAALLALGVVVLLCRWTFSTAPRDQRAARARAAAAARGDYGLLVPVAAARTQADATALRGVLTAAGIRCTVARDGGGPDAGWHLLVFRADADRASALVRS
jgi:hypothetical protein